jgi:hypothetical protein
MWASFLDLIFGRRDPEVERFASSSSVTLTLISEEQLGFDVGYGLMDSRRVVASSDAVVASMASVERGFSSVKHPGDGCAEREVEVTSRACA